MKSKSWHFHFIFMDKEIVMTLFYCREAIRCLIWLEVGIPTLGFDWIVLNDPGGRVCHQQYANQTCRLQSGAKKENLWGEFVDQSGIDTLKRSFFEVSRRSRTQSIQFRVILFSNNVCIIIQIMFNKIQVLHLHIDLQHQ